ncbi:hypothetical protein [Actinokineospora sp. HUAS TT18]|uniref:hypothetical protein n=1 Tax=Actinokineospora sp. HUAS TT18 TaxID=3447451 RepID=UPI003F528AC0
MPFVDLWDQVSGRRRAYGQGRALNADRLAAVAGQPRDRLARALIELRVPRPDWLALRHEPQRGCHRCNARHPGGPVLQLLGHHNYLCTRHSVWIGPPDQTDHPQPALDELPEIVAAQHQHLRLLRRIGPAATYDAVITGFLICGHRWRREPTSHTDVCHNWDRRATQLIPPDTENTTFSVSRLFAATYPEAVHLAELIGSLHWRRLAAGDPEDQRRFTTEIGSRLGQPDYRPTRVNDPIAHWIDQRCWAPPALPPSDFRSDQTFGGPKYRKPVKNAEQARQHGAFWFTTHRRGGAMLLQHRSMTTVRPREPLVLHTPDHESDKPVNIDYFRPQPATTTYLDTATEPVPWPQQTRIRTHPWFAGGQP